MRSSSVLRDGKRSEAVALHGRHRGENIPRDEGQVLHGRTEAFGNEMAGQRTAVLGAVQGDAQAAAVILDHLAAHQAGRIDDIHHRRLMGGEDGGIEQDPGQHLLVVHGLRHMVDGHQAGIAGLPGIADRLEIDLPQPRAER